MTLWYFAENQSPALFLFLAWVLKFLTEWKQHSSHLGPQSSVKESKENIFKGGLMKPILDTVTCSFGVGWRRRRGLKDLLERVGHVAWRAALTVWFRCLPYLIIWRYFLYRIDVAVYEGALCKVQGCAFWGSIFLKLRAEQTGPTAGFGAFALGQFCCISVCVVSPEGVAACVNQDPSMGLT